MTAGAGGAVCCFLSRPLGSPLIRFGPLHNNEGDETYGDTSCMQ